jgi:hypothetical protein
MATLIPIDAEAPGENIIELLEESLADAKAGKLSSIAIACVWRDGCTSHAFSKPPNAALLLGSVTRLEHKICHRILDDEV